MSHIAGSVTQISANPRNHWARALAAIDLRELGQGYKANRILDTIRYNDNIESDLFLFFETLINGVATNDDVRKINIPSDYNRGIGGPLHPPFRSIKDGASFPKPYPSGLALPDMVGNCNDFRYIEEYANWRSSAGAALPIDIIHVDEKGEGIPSLLASIAAQSYAGRIRLHILGEKPSGWKKPRGLDVTFHAIAFPSEEANALLWRISGDTRLLLFTSGVIDLDPMTFLRIAHMGQISDQVVQTLIPPLADSGATPFCTSAHKNIVNRRYPFRDVLGLNFAVTSTLFRNVGGLFEPRFGGAYHAGREFCFRLYNRGCYFQPIATRNIRDFSAKKGQGAADAKLYVQLCPNHWDRKTDGAHEVPKVSIYIPAYKAGKYIRRAIDSVLEQDMQDLEVCIADDGSPDDTLGVLERHYGDEPRVRWTTGANGGIGFASNRAIAMARGIYIGQLDSDDRLKPGAVRRLADFLDENTDVACCYGSCERIDADENFLKNEYSWPVFSREKMMITSIAHHFRMFRKLAWERTEKFREDIVNAVDYDIFLKLSEVGKFHHIDEILYQRRWHGENTSNVNEGFQTTNTYRVQREALMRSGLAHYWDIHIADPKEPRRVTYQRAEGRPLVMFWPYYRANPYQRLLYAPHANDAEFCAGTIDAALQMITISERPAEHIFHLHWLNFLFKAGMSEQEAAASANEFIAKLEKFKTLGGKVVWTIHNVISHDAEHREVEVNLSKKLTELADALHLHSEYSIAEVEALFPIPRHKVLIARHGHYVGAYADLVSQDAARSYLGLAPADDVILFNGQVRKYKGIGTLVEAFRKVLAQRPNALLLIAGAAPESPIENLATPLSAFERTRIRIVDRYIDDAELQVFLKAADFAVYPYRNVLTSGSLMLALTFGVPTVITEAGMIREVMGGGDAGIVYDGSAAELEKALAAMLVAKDDGGLNAMAEEARRLAKACSWERVLQNIL
ncbi:glycosyltransferase [Sphingomonas bisphenolicum]